MAKTGNLQSKSLSYQGTLARNVSSRWFSVFLGSKRLHGKWNTAGSRTTWTSLAFSTHSLGASTYLLQSHKNTQRKRVKEGTVMVERHVCIHRYKFQLSPVLNTKPTLTTAHRLDGMATGYVLTVRGSNPGGGKIFRICPDRPWGPSSLPYNGYRVLRGGKERPGRDADPSHPSSAVVMK